MASDSTSQHNLWTNALRMMGVCRYNGYMYSKRCVVCGDSYSTAAKNSMTCRELKCERTYRTYYQTAYRNATHEEVTTRARQLRAEIAAKKKDLNKLNIAIEIHRNRDQELSKKPR